MYNDDLLILVYLIIDYLHYPDIMEARDTSSPGYLYEEYRVFLVLCHDSIENILHFCPNS